MQKSGIARFTCLFGRVFCQSDRPSRLTGKAGGVPGSVFCVYRWSRGGAGPHTGGGA